jgi:RNA polymerase primary sigma factor
LFHVNRVANKLQEILGHAPTTGELAAECGLPETTIQRVRQAVLTTVSLDASPGLEDDDRSYADLVADEGARTAREYLEEQDLQGLLDSSIGLLSEREQQVLRMRFGLGGLDAQTLDEVGATFGLTRERIRQIQASALKKLRGRMAKKVGRKW